MFIDFSKLRFLSTPAFQLSWKKEGKFDNTGWPEKKRPKKGKINKKIDRQNTFLHSMNVIYSESSMN